MNREDVAMDVTVQNVEILRGRLEQAEHCIREVAASLAWNCFGECRAVHDGPIMPAQGALEMARDFLASQKGERNQCDGCQAGIPLEDGAHRMGLPGGYPDLMSCQKERYEHPEQAEGAQGELWAVHAQGPDDLYAAFCREDAEKHAAELNALPMPEGISVGAVVIPSPWSAAEHWQYLAEQEREHKDAIEGQRRNLAATLLSQNHELMAARAALAQPSPAPELERPEVVAFLMKPDTYEPYVGLRRDGTCDCVEPLMTVAQHERIVESLQAEVLSWRETVRFNESCWAEERGVMIDKIQTIRGGIPLAIAAIEDGAVMITGIEDRLFKALSEHTHWKRKTASLELYAAPVAQAGQVPEVSGIARAYDHPRAVILYLRKEPTDDDLRAIQEGLRVLAAAPQPAKGE